MEKYRTPPRISNTHKHSQRTASSPTRGDGKEGNIGDMKESSFSDKVYPLFTYS